ncbi:hypothetical protein C8J57DRAFT_1508280 [Mycena rebaudengoi]|nr:hypothetical protein C8J57DRAFT_1508280 [Mycena rebaudengoi]
MFSSVSTVLSVSQVNRNLKRIAYAKHLWKRLIEDLATRSLIDLPRDRDYSTAELIEEVKRVVLGPQTWSSAFPSGPIVSRELLVPRTPIGLGIELWNVLDCTVVWSLPEASFSRSHVELIDEETAIFVGFGFVPQQLVVRVIRISLNTVDSTELFTVKAQPGISGINCPAVSGDFFLCTLAIRSRKRNLVIGNWRTKKVAVLMYEPPYPDPELHDRAQLVAGLLFFTARVHPSSPLRLDGTINIYDLPAVVVQDLPLDEGVFQTKLMVHESPLRHDTYKCTLTRLSGDANSIPERRCTLYTFHFSMAGTNGHVVEWKQTPSAVGVPCLDYSHGAISYAGYVDVAPGLRLPRSIVNMHLRDPRTGIKSEKKPLLCAPNTVLIRSLSPYSHAVATSTYSHYVISYYV